MFGHQNHQDENNDAPAENHVADGSVGGDMPWQHPGHPLDDSQPAQPAATPAPTSDSTISDDHASDNPPAEPEAHVYVPDNGPASDDDNDSADDDHADKTRGPAMGGDANDLIDIKQDALNKLTPLVDHLEQTPEEKFRTTMMMIQASDNQSLIQTAYAAAQKISDEKVRAQALLDVINEINYFTQPHDKHDQDD